jgi:cation diffusion facilitator CzcD-associated flavoprotein CzcO
MGQSDGVRPRLRALVIGAGVAGLVATIELDEAGVDVTVVEKADRLGGTWRDNTYPGIACDVPSHLYSYSFEPNPDWSHTFAPGPEIQAYLESIAAKYGIVDRIRFDTEIVELTHVPGGWVARTSAGDELHADVVVAATGVLHHPSYPDIVDLDRFAGPCFHSARWDHSVDLDGTRVGVVGAGSTAIQIIAAIAGRVSELHSFQRSPQWVLPVPNDPIAAEERRRLAEDPEAIAERRAHLSGTFEAAFADVVVDASSPQLQVIEELCRTNLETNVADPELRERLRPDYRAACKRLIVSPDYYQAVSRPNVRVVPETIERAEPAGLRTCDGRLHELDVLVLATGFRVDRFLRPIRVTGRDGVTLDEVWAQRPSAYLGMSIPRFPNLFLLNGPNGPVGNFSLIEVAELQVSYLRKLLEHLGDDAVDEIVATEAATDRFEDARVEAAKHTVWATGCRSWYLDDRGIPAAWPWTFGRYREVLAEPELADFDLGRARTGDRTAAPETPPTVEA